MSMYHEKPNDDSAFFIGGTNMTDQDSKDWYIGLMSGTSLDGVDGVLVQLPTQPSVHGAPMQMLAATHQAFPDDVRAAALALQSVSENEIEREALLGNRLAELYASCVQTLKSKLQQHDAQAQIRAVGVHGQTIRHRPELGFTRQTNQPALLAERCGIDVIADFRSRDVAAGGQGAPLVPAFHRAVFGRTGACRVVLNIGGMSNISILHADGKTSGFDTGPGNVLMDAWISLHQQQNYDQDGTWAQQGTPDAALLAALLDEAFLRQAPPKSTGRDLFHLPWLQQKLQNFSHVVALDVQATLCQFTARSIADAIKRYAPDVSEIYVCGGGAMNLTLMQMLRAEFPVGNERAANNAVMIAATDVLGVSAMHVEALAFAWLAQRFILRLPGNLPEVTGAQGLRVLGALYPA
jgi:anhydro-N-acetylmuramic acid kinase